MDMALAALVLLGLVVGNGIATRTVLRDELSEKSQRIAQIAVVWLVPVFGALFIFALHRRPEEPSRKYRENLDPGDDYGMSGRSARATRAEIED